jgi:hypothetical protein
VPHNKSKPGFMSASGPARKNKGRISAARKPVSTDLPGVEQEESAEVVGRPFRGRLFHRFVRSRVAAQLVHDHDFDPVSAKDTVEAVSDTEIDAEASKVGVQTAVGDGGFLQWLKDHQEQIFQLIMAIVQILAMFGAKSVKKGAGRKKDHKDEDSSSAPTEQ